MKLNNKGFSLVEILAVLIILGIISAIMVPTVTGILNQNKEKSYEKLKETIISSTKIYVSNNRYDISLMETCSSGKKIKIKQIADSPDNLNGKIALSLLANAGDLDEKIVDPRARETKLNLENSYIIVTFNCNTKDYEYELKDEYLNWNDN